MVETVKTVEMVKKADHADTANKPTVSHHMKEP